MNWDAQKTAFLRLKQRLAETEKALALKQIDLESVLVQADEVSHTDPLTFLPNRKQIIADLQREVEANRQASAPLTIFMLDFDHFKQVNDAYGHSAGDQVLRSLASQLQANIRQSDKLGRYGGEEFLALLPATSLERAIQLAKRLLKVARQCRVAVGNGQFAQVTISIGIAQHQSQAETWEDLLKRADQALYASKNRGRDQWSVAEFNHLRLED
jgi:diguanylate cyclase (GGDEF)-like protein